MSEYESSRSRAPASSIGSAEPAPSPQAPEELAEQKLCAFGREVTQLARLGEAIDRAFAENEPQRWTEASARVPALVTRVKQLATQARARAHDLPPPYRLEFELTLARAGDASSVGRIQALLQGVR